MSLKSTQRKDDDAWTDTDGCVDEPVVQRRWLTLEVFIVMTRVHEYGTVANAKSEKSMICSVAPDFNAQQLVNLKNDNIVL